MPPIYALEWTGWGGGTAITGMICARLETSCKNPRPLPEWGEGGGVPIHSAAIIKLTRQRGRKLTL